jgi:hypothetical protein
MPESESSYEIDFDDHGRIHVRDAELAYRLLMLAESKKGIEIVIDARPDRTESDEWKDTLPPMNGESCPKTNLACMAISNAPCPNPINAGTGCMNSICPFLGSLQISSLVAASWGQLAQNAGGGGP